MGMLSNDSQESMMSEINVTPLVDVMLVLLTVFIVTAPLLMNAVSVKLPKASAAPATIQPNTAHISISQQGDIFLDEVKLSQTALEQRLNDGAKASDYAVDIMADEKVEYGTVAKVMAAIQRAKITKFTFVMMPDIHNPSEPAEDLTADTSIGQ
jgi:biopolymer transport protein ExbD